MHLSPILPCLILLFHVTLQQQGTGSVPCFTKLAFPVAAPLCGVAATSAVERGDNVLASQPV